MSVLVETSLGDLVIDLHTDQAPVSCENFLKLCKVKYYNYAPFFNIRKGISFQTGDPLGPDSKESTGGSSIWGVLAGPSKREFTPEFHPDLNHSVQGTVSMATAERGMGQRLMATSQFIVTLADDLDHLDGKGAVFGKVVEGFDVLRMINDAFVDNKGRPLRDIRIKHTVVLDDPFPDPPNLVEPLGSPAPTPAQLATVRIADDEKLDDDLDEEAMEELRRQREAKAQALTLEMVGDLPFAEVKPPENVLFVCKLNPVTQDDDLELIFSRFGTILSCEVIRDKKTQDSLQYAFVEFEHKEDCEQAFFKMQDVLIDDHRIHVDFSQSVSRLSDSWRTATNTQRRKQANFGGITGLERRRQYRDIEEHGGNEYELVHGNGHRPVDGMKERHRPQSPRQRNRRSRSPGRRPNDHHERSAKENGRGSYQQARDYRYRRSRSRDRQRYRDEKR